MPSLFSVYMSSARIQSSPKWAFYDSLPAEFNFYRKYNLKKWILADIKFKPQAKQEFKIRSVFPRMYWTISLTMAWQSYSSVDSTMD